MGGRDVRGAAKRRVRRKAERPGELLDAAFAEFSQKGYAGATLDGIAARAGVTKGTIYLYFDGKEHLFISMVREFTKPVRDEALGLFDSFEGPTMALLQRQLGLIYRTMAADRRAREILRMLVAEGGRFPELADRYYDEILAPALEALRRALRRGIARGEIRDAGIAEHPQLVFAPVVLLDLWMLLFAGRHPVDVESYFRAHLDLLFDGLSTEDGRKRTHTS